MIRMYMIVYACYIYYVHWDNTCIWYAYICMIHQWYISYRYYKYRHNISNHVAKYITMRIDWKVVGTSAAPDAYRSRRPHRPCQSQLPILWSLRQIAADGTGMSQVHLILSCLPWDLRIGSIDLSECCLSFLTVAKPQTASDGVTLPSSHPCQPSKIWRARRAFSSSTKFTKA